MPNTPVRAAAEGLPEIRQVLFDQGEAIREASELVRAIFCAVNEEVFHDKRDCHAFNRLTIMVMDAIKKAQLLQGEALDLARTPEQKAFLARLSAQAKADDE